MPPSEATQFARDVPRTLSHADFLADLQVVTGDPTVVTAAIPVSAAMFGQRELPFRSVLEPMPTGARLRALDIAPDGPGWALVAGEAGAGRGGVARPAARSSMGALCIVSAGKAVALAAGLFTLSWTHSVEKTEWKEWWSVTPAGLAVVSARIEGSGAGMEPPEDAVFDGSGWVYHPDLPPRQRVVLADSGVAGQWRFCAAGTCRDLGDGSGPIVLEACP